MNQAFVKLVFVFIILLFSQISYAFDIPNYPFLKNYPKSEYNAGSQNWDIIQGNNDEIYFANNLGVLKFNGNTWNKVKVTNRSIVRSLCNYQNDSILVGAYNEFGVVYSNEFGEMKYKSWVPRLPEKYNSFQEIWRIHHIGEIVIIQSFYYLFIFEDGKFIKAIEPKSLFKFSFLINGKLYIQDINEGLFVYENIELKPTKIGKWFSGKEIWSILPYENDSLIICTQFNGLYTFNGNVVKKWNCEANEFLEKNNLFSAIKKENGQYVFGSMLNGLIICNKQGKIISHQNTLVGIQNNTILSLFEDKSENIWMGLDNGIDYAKTNSALSYVTKKGGFGMGYTAAVYNKKLYAGTNQGLYFIPLKTKDNTSNFTTDFTNIEQIEGQVWNLITIENQLYCCHNFGLHSITKNSITEISQLTGFWNVAIIPDQPDFLLLGSYEGFFILNKKNNQITKLKGLMESSRRFVFQPDGTILLSHGYKGVYQLKLNIADTSIQVLNLFNGSNQLPNDFGNEVFAFRNNTIIATDSGVYHFNNNQISRLNIWDSFYENKANQLTNIIEVENSKFWSFKDAKIYYTTYLNDNMHETNFKLFLPLANTFPHNHENVSYFNENKYLIGNEQGFVLYNENMEMKGSERIKIGIASAYYSDKNSNESIKIPFQKNESGYEISKLKYDQSLIRINLSMPYYEDQNLVSYRYRKNQGPWSNWTSDNNLKFDNLQEGNYFIDIETSIDKSNVTGTQTITFDIEPPFYRRWYTYLIYLALFFSLTLLASQLIKNQIEKEKQRETLKQQKQNFEKELALKREADLAQNELMKFKNETLQTDIKNKSKELANTTMSIINKNKILRQIKEVLTDSDKEDSKIRKLIKQIDKEIENQDNWTVFEQNFDKVHENFLKRLKDKHSELTPKDLRLAAYLRMNLTSKEIAPLLNISVRSVEISRYRLRKKMDLGHDQNLTEYLMST